MAKFEPVSDPARMAVHGFDKPYVEVHHDFVLALGK
jgi:hypothetical protein